MKYILFLITSLFLTTSLFAQNTQLRNTLILPIEVFGKNGATESIFLNINDAANMANIAGLRIKVHGLTYTNKASIKINNSAWKDINNSNIVFLNPVEYGMQGMGTTYFTGPASTLSLLIPFSAATFSTTNTVTFRFNDFNGLTVGYRILDIGVIKSNYADLTLHTKKVQDDPSKWKPYSTDAARINNGSNKWFNATLTHNGVPIMAKCEDCHVHEGYDLKYFNYSNKSIVLRSTALHSLSLQDAQDIASFIRTRNVTYEPDARPWNPVYQPGPGMDSKPVRSWAAGAGLDWVVTNQWITVTNIFPAGIASGLMNYGTNGLKPFDPTLYSLNQREIPIPIQLPDWNRWLPHIHPKDAYSTFTNQLNDLQYVYSYHFNRLSSPSFNKNVNGSQYFFSACFGLSFYSFKLFEAVGFPAASYTSKIFAEEQLKSMSAFKWVNVKEFEFALLFDLQELGNIQIGNGTYTDFGWDAPPGAWSDKRRWYDQHVFYTAPHTRKVPIDTTELFPLGMTSYSGWAPESASWYMLGLTLNSGNRGLWDQHSLDQGYLPAFAAASFGGGGGGDGRWTSNFVSTWGMWIITFVKLMEGTDRGFPSQSHDGYQVITPWNTLSDVATLRPDDLHIGRWFTNSVQRQDYSAFLNLASTVLCDKMDRYSRQYYLTNWPGNHTRTDGARTYYDFMIKLESSLNLINGAYNGDINISPTTINKVRNIRKKLYPDKP